MQQKERERETVSKKRERQTDWHIEGQTERWRYVGKKRDRKVERDAQRQTDKEMIRGK